LPRRSEHLIECDDPRWLGVSGELGIELIYAIAHSPWSQGTTERFYGTFQGRFSKLQPTYCGNSPQTRPECVEQLKCDPEAVPTLDKVRRDFAAWLDIYHRTAHGGLDGQTPLAVWQTASG
jgi:putative transposase